MPPKRGASELSDDNPNDRSPPAMPPPRRTSPRKPASTPPANPPSRPPHSAITPSSSSQPLAQLIEQSPGPSNSPPNRVSSTPQKRGLKAALKPILTTAPTDPLFIYMFGANESGQLATNHGRQLPADFRPIWSPTLNRAFEAQPPVQVALGAAHGVALTASDKVLTWGCADFGQLGRELDDEEGEGLSDQEVRGAVEKRTMPHDVAGTFPEGTVWTQVAASEHACFGLTERGEVWGWGSFRNNEGIIGLLPPTSSSTPSTTSTLTKRRKLSTFSSLSLRNHRDKDQPPPHPTPLYKPTVLPSLPRVTHLATAASSNHLLALTPTGQVYALGAGEQNQLGRRLTERNKLHGLTAEKIDFRLPKNVTGNRKITIKHIATGGDSSFAIDTEGRVWSWGRDEFGHLGHFDADDEQQGPDATPGQAQSSSSPPKSPATAGPRLCASTTHLENITSIAAGRDHAVALTEKGKLYSWGRIDGFGTGHLGTSIPVADVRKVGEHAEPPVRLDEVGGVDFCEGPNLLVRARELDVRAEALKPAAKGAKKAKAAKKAKQAASKSEVEDVPVKIRTIAAGAHHTIAVSDPLPHPHLRDSPEPADKSVCPHSSGRKKQTGIAVAWGSGEGWRLGLGGRVWVEGKGEGDGEKVGGRWVDTKGCGEVDQEVPVQMYVEELRREQRGLVGVVVGSAFGALLGKGERMWVDEWVPGMPSGKFKYLRDRAAMGSGGDRDEDGDGDGNDFGGDVEDVGRGDEGDVDVEMGEDVAPVATPVLSPDGSSGS